MPCNVIPVLKTDVDSFQILEYGPLLEKGRTRGMDNGTPHTASCK
jgi:hypothetical protein